MQITIELLEDIAAGLQSKWKDLPRAVLEEQVKTRKRLTTSTVAHDSAPSKQQEKTMRTFELRVYTLRTKQALDFYREKIYPRHLNSFPLFGIEAHGFWTAREDVEPRLFVLASYAAGEDPGEVARRYMQSTEFADDIRNFNVSDIVGVESTILIPSTSSPLK